MIKKRTGLLVGIFVIISMLGSTGCIGTRANQAMQAMDNNDYGELQRLQDRIPEDIENAQRIVETGVKIKDYATGLGLPTGGRNTEGLENWVLDQSNPSTRSTTPTAPTTGPSVTQRSWGERFWSAVDGLVDVTGEIFGGKTSSSEAEGSGGAGDSGSSGSGPGGGCNDGCK